MVKKSRLSGDIAQKIISKKCKLRPGFVDSAMGYGEIDKKIDDFYEK